MTRFNAFTTTLLMLVASATSLSAQAISPEVEDTPTALEPSPIDVQPFKLPSGAKDPAKERTPLDVPQTRAKDETTPPPLKPIGESRVPSIDPYNNAIEVKGAPAELSAGTSKAPTYIMGTNVIVAYSEKKEEIWGFSKITGTWAKQAITPAAEKKLVPVVASEVASLQVAESIYAYSSKTGSWDVLRLPKGRKARMSFDDDVVLVEDGQSVYTFPASTGRWSSPSTTLGADLPKAAGLDESNPYGPGMFATRESTTEIQMKVFALQFISADSAASMLRLMFDSERVLVAPEERSNCLIVRGSKASLAEIEALLIRLDTNESAPKADKTLRQRVRGRDGMLGGYAQIDIDEDGYPDAIEPGTEQQLLEQLSLEFQRFNQETVTIASRYRKLMESGRSARGALQDLKKQLHGSVDAAFAARQKLQHVEVAELRRELHSIQQTIAARERLKDKIIERRVSDLLNPQLRWNTQANKIANPGRASSSNPTSNNQSAMFDVIESDDNPLATRRKELEERRKTLFEDIVGIELSQIEANDSTSKDYIKRLSDEDLKRLPAEDKHQFEVEVERTKNRSKEFDDRKAALEAELNVIEQQLEHLDSRLRESDEGNGSTLNPSVVNRFPNPPRTSLIFFHADWCLTCKALKPEIKKLEADGLPIVFRDLTHNEPPATLTGVKTIPAFELWVDGQLKERVGGRDYQPLIEKLRAALSGKNVASSYKALTPSGSTASVTVLEVELAAAESELKRVETLFRTGLVTDTSLEKAKLEVEVLKQQLADSHRRRDSEERLLVIDLKSAQLEFEAAAVELTRMEKLNKRNPSVISVSELDRLRLTVAQGELAVQRAETKLDLHRGQAAASPTKE